jgi:glycosyltransferase involved in cell wall biosynthesis
LKVAVDGRCLTRNPTGVANYLICALNELTRQKQDWDFYLLVNTDLNKEARDRLVPRKNLILLKEPFFLLKEIGIIWYIFKISNILKDLKPDYFLAPVTVLPPFIPPQIRTIVIVYDVVFKQYKDTMGFINRFFSTFMLDKSIKRAGILWAISGYTKSEVERFYPDRYCKEIQVGCAVDKNIYKKLDIPPEEKQALLQKFNLNEKFIVFVGTVEPRKNLKFLLSLMPDLAKQGFSLLVVGAKGWGKTEIADIVNSPGFPREKVIFSGFITTGELVKLYNTASLFVSASLNEGFGLPQLEAMSCGCPVVTAHNSAMIEVAGEGGTTVKGYEAEDWLRAINSTFENRELFVKKGLEQAEKFNWPAIIKNFSENLNR